jgi:hypothetical protein
VTRGRSRARTSPHESWRSPRRAGIECAQNALLEPGGVPRRGESTRGQVGIDAGRAASARRAVGDRVRRALRVGSAARVVQTPGVRTVSTPNATAASLSVVVELSTVLRPRPGAPHAARAESRQLRPSAGGRMRSRAAVRTDPRRVGDVRRIQPCPARKAYEPALGRRNSILRLRTFAS